MAETPTGVTPATERGTRGRRGGSFFKRNRAVVLGGGALGAFLLMSHKGSAAGAGNAGSNQDQLQATANTLAAETAALQGAGQAPFGVSPSAPEPASGLVGSGDGSGSILTGDPGAAAGGGGSGDGGGTDGGAVGGSAPVGPINVTINSPDRGRRRPRPTGAGKGSHPGQKARAGAAKGHGGHAGTQTHTRGAPSHKGGTAAHSPAVAPKQGAAGRPAPAARSGGHPETPHRTAKGKKKKSPARVESIFGMGAGVVVMGREFPGAQSHRMGPPFQDAAGRICRRVIVDYGGRSEQMIVHGDGSEWTDNPPGVNPPSRGVPMTMVRGDRA